MRGVISQRLSQLLWRRTTHMQIQKACPNGEPKVRDLTKTDDPRIQPAVETGGVTGVERTTGQMSFPSTLNDSSVPAVQG